MAGTLALESRAWVGVADSEATWTVYETGTLKVRVCSPVPWVVSSCRGPAAAQQIEWIVNSSQTSAVAPPNTEESPTVMHTGVLQYCR